VCKNIVLLASLLDRDGIEISKMEPYKESFLLELVPFELMENFRVGKKKSWAFCLFFWMEDYTKLWSEIVIDS